MGDSPANAYIKPNLHRARAVAALYVVALVVLTVLAPGCRRSEPPRIVLYTSIPPEIVRPVVEEFEAEHEAAVTIVDHDAAGAYGGPAQLIASSGESLDDPPPPADVFWAASVFEAVSLAEAGRLVEHLSDATADWPRDYRDGRRRWYGLAVQSRVIAYAPERISGDDIPETWMDLTDTRYAGRVAIPGPDDPATAGHFGAMHAYWDRRFEYGFFEAFMMGLRDNDVIVLPDSQAVIDALMSGEADVVMTDEAAVRRAVDAGASIDFILPRHSVIDSDDEPQSGTLEYPQAVMRVAHDDRTDKADRLGRDLADFLLSRKVGRMLAESPGGYRPVHPDLAEAFADRAAPDPLGLRYRTIGRHMTQAVDIARRILDPMQPES